MNSSVDPLTGTVTGGLILVLLLAVVLAALLSIILLIAYRRAVVRLQRATSSEERIPEASSGVPLLEPRLTMPPLTTLNRDFIISWGGPAHLLYRRARQAIGGTAAVYMAAAVTYAALMALGFLLADGTGLNLSRFLLMAWVFAWPVVLTLNRISVIGRKAQGVIFLVYFLALIALNWPAVARNPEVSWNDVLYVWLTYNGLPTLLVLAFLNRRVRAVGPLVLVLTTIGVTGSMVVLALVGRSDAFAYQLAGLAVALGLNAGGTLLTLLVAVFLLVGGIGGWLAARWIQRWYEERKLSDQSITVDAIWLLFAITLSVFLAFEGLGWMLVAVAAFLAYKLASRIGFALLQQEQLPAASVPRLLLLRVFSLGKRSQRLYDGLTLYWRYVGQLRLISGPDLATSTIEPDEFFTFLRGRLRTLFIDSHGALERRLAELRDVRDRDGRFRVQEFFCSGAAWRMTLVRLASEEQSDVVLMDLRTFSSKNEGCLFEIEALVNLVPLRRVLFLVAEAKETEFLRDNLQTFWARMRLDSPNRRNPPGEIRLFRSSGSVSADLPALLQIIGSMAVDDTSRPAAELLGEPQPA